MYKIYIITNNVTHKRYVGQTKRTLHQRWTAHKLYAKNGLDLFFYRSIRKHGPDAFSIQEIATAETKDWANHLEKVWIQILNTTHPDWGYNSTTGGDGGALVGESLERMKVGVAEFWRRPENRKRASETRKGTRLGPLNPMYGRRGYGKPHTEETKAIIGQKAKERHQDPEYKARMSAANKGKHHTEVGRANIAKALVGNQYRKGISHDEASKEKIRQGMIKAGEIRRSRKAVAA